MLEFFGNVFVYLATLGLTIYVSYLAYDRILTLPQPETITELVKFYIHNPEGYLKITGLTLVAFALNLILTAATVRNAIVATEEFVTWLCVAFGS